MTAQPTETTTRLVTGAELLAMGDIGPCELIDGEIVRMSPTGEVHGYLESRLTFFLYRFNQDAQAGWVLGGEVGIFIRHNPDRIRGADLAFWSKEKLPNGPSTGFSETAPDLVVEILSPTDRWAEMRQKLDDYFSIGVSTVWIADPQEETVFDYRSATQRTALRTGDTLVGTGPLTGFTLSVAELFAY